MGGYALGRRRPLCHPRIASMPLIAAAGLAKANAQRLALIIPSRNHWAFADQAFCPGNRSEAPANALTLPHAKLGA